MAQLIDTINPKYKQLIWTNKNQQKLVFANSRRANNGALILQRTPVVAGIPVTIGTLDGWMDRADFTALQAHSNTVLTPFTVVINSDTLNVVWDHTGDAPVQGEDLFPVVGGCDTLTNVTLKFLTV